MPPKTIPEVFGLKPDMTTRVINAPDNYAEIMSGWQFKISAGKLDFAHLFVQNQATLHRQLPKLKGQLKPNGMIWVSWLKKSAVQRSGIKTDVNENDIRNFAPEIGLVDIKVCAVSDIWSGLKLVIPVKDR